MKPMLAKAYKNDLTPNVFPGYVQPKYDGIRCLLAQGGTLFSRSMKSIPNEHIRRMFAEAVSDLDQPFVIDGELTIGRPEESSYNHTQSIVMSHSKDPTGLVYTIFDVVAPSVPYEERKKLRYNVCDRLRNRMPWAQNAIDINAHDVGDFEEGAAYLIYLGFEGAIYRSAAGLYKYGRSTSREGYLIKFKEFTDDEALITGFEELMHNMNEAYKNELGYTAHSSHKENLVAGNTLGRLVCDYKGQEIRVGTGFSDALRKHIWDNQGKYHATWIKFKYMSYGTQEKPRHPVFLGFRNERDIDVDTPAVGSG